MLVLGKRGVHADFAKLHLDSRLERVLRTSTQPILMASRAIRRVLVALSPLTSGPECHVVMAATDNADNRSRIAWAEAVLRENHVGCQTHVLPGDASKVLPAYVESHDIHLLAMGAHGHSRMRELLLGSTTITLIRRCLLPVLVVR